jgi:hypothetical protein
MSEMVNTYLPFYPARSTFIQTGKNPRGYDAGQRFWRFFAKQVKA